jgi:hypothetical protein
LVLKSGFYLEPGNGINRTSDASLLDSKHRREGAISALIFFTRSASFSTPASRVASLIAFPSAFLAYLALASTTVAPISHSTVSTSTEVVRASEKVEASEEVEAPEGVEAAVDVEAAEELRVFKTWKQKEISGFGTTGSHHCL